MNFCRICKQKPAFSWKSSKFVTVLLCIIIAGIMAVILAIAAHTTFNADDYGSLIEYQAGGGICGILKNAARLTAEAYMQHMGGYTSYFLGNSLFFCMVEGWLSPPVVMMVGTFLLMTVLCLFVIKAVSSAGICRGSAERNVGLLFAAVVLLCVYDTRAWPEIDNWLSGYNAYGWATIFGLSAAAWMCHCGNLPRGRLVLAAVFAFLSSGGTLQVTGGICCVLLAILLIKVLQGIAKRSDWIIFGAAFLGAVINVSAPGNFVRRNSLDPNGFHPGIALPFVIQWGNDVWLRILTHFWVLAFLAGIFLLGIHLQDRIRPETWKLLLLVVACVSAPYVSAFPVCMGYGGGYFPNRCLWAATLLASLALLTGVFVLGSLAGRFTQGRGDKILTSAITAGILFLAVFGAVRLPDMSTIYTTLCHLVDGTVQNYCEEVELLLADIAQQEGPAVKVSYQPSPIEEIKSFVISSGPENEANQYLAAYYGFDSIVYEP